MKQEIKNKAVSFISEKQARTFGHAYWLVNDECMSELNWSIYTDIGEFINDYSYREALINDYRALEVFFTTEIGQELVTRATLK